MKEWYVFTEDNDGNDKCLGTVKSLNIITAPIDFVHENFDTSYMTDEERWALEDSMWAQPYPF